LLILGTYRDAEAGDQHPLMAAVYELVRERVVDEIALHPLDLQGTAAIIRNQLNGKIIPEELITLIHVRAEGNPFFTEELLRALAAQRILDDPAAQWDPQGIDPIRLPRSVMSAINQRVSRLPASSQQLLRMASVLGAEWELKMLQLVTGRSESEALDDLDAAIGAHLLRSTDHDVSETYAFSHVLVQQALYEELPPHRRRRIHLRVAQMLESLDDAPSPAPAELARHFALGGDRSRAVEYAVAAGQQAGSRYAPAEAVYHYQFALQLLLETGDGPQTANVRRRLAEELYDLNRIDQAQSMFDAALARFERVGDELGQALVHAGIGRLHLGRYDSAVALRHLDHALSLWPPEREDAELLQLILMATRAKIFSADSGAIAMAERAAQIAERIGDTAGLALATLYIATSRSGTDPRVAPVLETLERSDQLARASGDLRTIVNTTTTRAIYTLQTGNLQSTRALRQQALAEASRSGEIERVVFGEQNLAYVYLLLGDWERGREAAWRARALDPQHRLTGYPGAAFLFWMEGEHEAALNEMNAFCAEARRRRDMQGLTHLASMADMLLQLERLPEAEAAVREAEAVVRRNFWWRLGSVFGPLAETLVRLRTTDAQGFLDEAEKLVDQSGQELARPQLLRARALWHLELGDPQAALAGLQASAAVARSQHAALQLGRTLAEEMQLAEELGDSSASESVTAELVALVEGIGSELRGLRWAAPFFRSAWKAS